MKKTFIKTKNVKRFIALMDELQNLPSNILKLAIQLTDLKFKDDAIHYLVICTNQFRQLTKLINKIEKLSQNQNHKFFKYTIKILQI